ncbi:MAG TPA: Gfo/Idh/MocA family oxidoreductase [Thermoleophilaceae bacterium]|nr:Gfo/Idh/MocA family oxidoreductase [Thermoleophilaceae bacterium]
MGETAQLRAGIVGTGFIGAVHARSVLLAGGRVAGVAASSPESGRAAAARLRAERSFDSAEALVESDEVDVVHVCTPNHLHVPLARAALRAGKHVVCEKPLALDDGGAGQLVELSDRVGLLGAVPFVYRYYPMVRELRERLTSGRCGALRLLHGTYLQDWLSQADDDNWRVDRALGGSSRAFADIGSHWCDLAEFASGQRIARLSARTATVVEQRAQAAGRPAFERGDGSGPARGVDTEDVAIVHVETDGGALGSVVVSQVSPGRKNRLWIEFDAAHEALAFDQENPEQLWRGRRDGVTLAQRDRDLLSDDAARLATLPAGHPQGYADCFDAFVADVYAAIAGDPEPEGLPLFADGRRAVQITEAVLASAAADGAWTDVAADLVEARP